MSSPSVGIVRPPPRSGTPAPTSTSYDAFYSFSDDSSDIQYFLVLGSGFVPRLSEMGAIFDAVRGKGR